MNENNKVSEEGQIRECTFESAHFSSNRESIAGIKRRIKSTIDIYKFYTSELDEVRPTNNSEWIMALCPFHDDKNPSLSINLDSGGFYCFGCKAKGSIFDFYMRKYTMRFREALEKLAQINGISLKG